MSTYSKKLMLKSNGERPTYHEITDKVREAVKESNISNGVVVVTTPHTTCSVFFEEMVHDRNWWGDEFLQVDLNETMERIIPECRTEGTYHYPGPLHAAFAEDICKDSKTRCLNTDAHIRATLIGNSSSFALVDGTIVTGPFGYIYFVDWDHKVVRDRAVYIQVIGD